MITEKSSCPAYFNGRYMALDEVAISPLDRGFLLGDSIYEVIPVYHGVGLGAERHWQRLMAGLQAVGIESPYALSDWPGVAAPLLSADEPAQMLYVQVTRGVEGSRKHRFPVLAEPTVLLFSTSFQPPIDGSYAGCAGHLQADLRWQRCNVKSTSLMGNVLAYRQLYTDGVADDEALLVRDGRVVEAPSSNLFIACDGVIRTPPLDNILPGVSRSLVIELARGEGLKVIEQAPDIAQLTAADEVWVTNSYEELKPIVTVDGDPIGSGRPGPVWRCLLERYQALKR
ncbi:aminotransferase class IV [Marinobacterium arenosum]|uniref:aminotransferase class IV n=1 Tax=Marinobacterium arenosum TaxID=2862496 RepID=UPI001C985467|nr:aminotransferase class IV [Marinobacterium arenosum]MBY4675412.1 aminotransferase class IV [Marinobacterium arenosum]